jgi:hypothetical protein
MFASSGRRLVGFQMYDSELSGGFDFVAQKSPTSLPSKISGWCKCIDSRESQALETGKK